MVAVLYGKDQIVFPAVETPAEEGAAVIDRASRGTKIDALAAPARWRADIESSRRPIHHNLMPIRIHFVAMFGVKKETLIASAALPVHPLQASVCPSEGKFQCKRDP